MATSNTAPTGGFVTLKAPRLALAAAEDFITAADGSPLALKTYHGAGFHGLDWCEVVSSGTKRTFNLADLADSSGDARGMMAKGLGWEVTLALQHDRMFPKLEILDMGEIWIAGAADDGSGNAIPAKKRVAIVDIGSDFGSDTTAQYKVTLRHMEGLMDQSGLITAKLDQLGRTITWKTTDTLAWTTAAAQPDLLPGSVAYDFTGLTATNVCSWPGLTLPNGTRIKVTGKTGGSGLTVDNIYYVRDTSASTGKLAATAGGSVVALGSDVTGTLVVLGPEGV